MRAPVPADTVVPTMSASPSPADRETEPGGQIALMVAAAVTGAVTGAASLSFALLLRRSDDLRSDLIRWAHHHHAIGLVVLVVAIAASTAAAALLVHRIEPHAEGSGIPRVEAIVEGRAEPGRFRILPVKYAGGLLAIGGGLALGREGPSVQMGGVIASVCGRLARLRDDELRMVIAGGAAAGLATAFNAPIAGGVFVLEELYKRFDHRATLATLTASGSGFAVTHLLHPEGTVFAVPTLADPALHRAPLIAAVSLVCALLAVLYNRAIMAALHFVDTTRIPIAARAVAIGVAVAVLAWFLPSWVGSGDELTQRALAGHGVLGTVVALIACRFVLGVVSYAANTPGGLFAPMLVLGSQTGLAVALSVGRAFSLSPAMLSGLALTGLVAFFTASVQAPVTGLILATEMTGSVAWLPPLLGAAAVALLTARALRSEPIYDALTARSARNARINREAATT